MAGLSYPFNSRFVLHGGAAPPKPVIVHINFNERIFKKYVR